MTDPASVPQSKSAGEFRLDLEQAREAISALVKVRDDLTALHAQAQRLSRQSRSDRSTQDLISLEAFELLAQKADGAPGSLAFALDAGIVEVQGLIDQMERDVAEQERVDDESETAFRA